MSDFNQEGADNEFAKQHGVLVLQIDRWREQGMPTDPELANAWLKARGKGKFAGHVHTGDSGSEPSALQEILDRGQSAVSGVLGLYARACAVEVAAYQEALAEPSASNVNAHAKAQESVADAAKAVAAHEVQCQRLVDAEEFKRCLTAQDGACVSLVQSMPYSLVDLLVDQPREEIVRVLQNWGKNVYLKKRRECAPFTRATVDVDRVLDTAEAEADKGANE